MKADWKIPTFFFLCKLFEYFANFVRSEDLEGILQAEGCNSCYQYTTIFFIYKKGYKIGSFCNVSNKMNAPSTKRPLKNSRHSSTVSAFNVGNRYSLEGDYLPGWNYNIS